MKFLRKLLGVKPKHVKPKHVCNKVVVYREHAYWARPFKEFPNFLDLQIGDYCPECNSEVEERFIKYGDHVPLPHPVTLDTFRVGLNSKSDLDGLPRWKDGWFYGKTWGIN